MGIRDNAFLVGTVGIECCEPQKEGFAPRTGLQRGNPPTGPTLAALVSCRSGWRARIYESKTRGICFSDEIKAILDSISQVPLAGRSSPVTCFPKQLDKGDLIGRQRPMQFLRSRIVGIPAGDHA